MRLIDADKLCLGIVEKGQASKRYKIGERWELNGEEIWRLESNGKCPCINADDYFYSHMPDDDWFCANGERRTEE